MDTNSTTAVIYVDPTCPDCEDCNPTCKKCGHKHKKHTTPYYPWVQPWQPPYSLPITWC